MLRRATGQLPEPGAGGFPQWWTNIGEDLLRGLTTSGPIEEVVDLDRRLRERQDAAREAQAADAIQRAGVQTFLAKKLVESLAKLSVDLTLGEAFAIATSMQVAGRGLQNVGNIRGTLQVWIQLPATAGIPAQIDPNTLGTKSAPHTQYRLGYNPETNLLTIMDLTTRKFVSGAKLGIRIVPATPSIAPVWALNTVADRPGYRRLAAGNIGSALTGAAAIPYMLTTPKDATEYFAALGLSMQAGGPVAGIGYTTTQMFKGIYARVTGQYNQSSASTEPDIDFEIVVTELAGDPNDPVTSSQPHDGI